MYKYIAKVWEKPEEFGFRSLMRQRLQKWRRQPAIVRINKPTRLNRAHSLGYKAKRGFITTRVRVRRGGLHKSRPKAGRRQKRMGVNKFVPAKNMGLIAEERSAKRFPNMKVLNSYWVGEDGQHKWFEVVLVDPTILK